MRFPWSAVVGQDALKRALILCAIDPAIGGVLVHGPRGVAKTTLARALAELVPGKFVELPLGATEERVTGALDLESALQAGKVEFAPGLLARAHEGVLYVDEVNLLPDALVDLLLDAAATGRNVVERDGVSHAHPARFVLIGSMNPEEGELRPQLLDRFGLSASADGVIPPAERAQIVTRRLEFDRDPEAFRARYAAEQQALVERCKRARELAARIELGGAALARVTERCHAAGVEGVRADLAMLRAARAHAAWSGRESIAIEDVDAVAELALAHRRPKGEGDPPGGGGRGGSSPPGSARRPDAADGGGPQRASASEARAGIGASKSAVGAAKTAGRADSERADSSGSRAPTPRELNEHDERAEDAARGESGVMAARPVQAARLAELPRWLTSAKGKHAARYRRGTPKQTSSSGVRARSGANQGAVDWFATLTRSALRRSTSRGYPAQSRSANRSREPRYDDSTPATVRNEPAARETSRLAAADVPPSVAGLASPELERAPVSRDRAPHIDLRGGEGDVASQVGRLITRDLGAERISGRGHAPERRCEERERGIAASAPRSAWKQEQGIVTVAQRSGAAPSLLRADLRYRARRAPSSQLWIVAVDCSTSMLRSGGLAVAKGVAHAIDAGARRSGARLAVLSFRGAGARLEVDSSPGRAVLPRAIAALGGGGGTPLRAALVAAGSLCKQTRWRGAGVFTRLLVLTDARVREPKASVPHLPAQLERVVVDCERGRTRLGRARQLTAALHAVYYRPTQAPVAGGLSVTRPSAAHTTRSV